MAIISGVTVNWRTSPRIITIPAPTVAVTLDDLQDTLLDLEDNDEGMLWTALRETAGGEDLGDGVAVAITMELQNAVIAFEARTTSVSSGTVTSDSSDGTMVIDTGADFVSDGVLAGAIVANRTDGSVATVTAVEATELTCYPLNDGTNNDWEIGDGYKIWNEIQCEVGGGNLLAVDGVGSAINPTLSTFGVQILRSLSSSATFISSEAAENSEKWAKLAFLNS